MIVKPGEAIPVDGTVALGESLVDQSSLTGESVPVEKAAGDKVFAGTINQQGALELHVTTRAAANSALARIVDAGARRRRSRSRTPRRWREWVGRYYTVVVMIGAALMLWPAAVRVRPRLAARRIYRAMTLLVVASPCALVIATPATILSAIANAARNGILFKGGRFIEALGRVKAMAFDKTGTLTHGRFEVTDVDRHRRAGENELLALGRERREALAAPARAGGGARGRGARGSTFTPAEQMMNHLGKGLVATPRRRSDRDRHAGAVRPRSASRRPRRRSSRCEALRARRARPR